MNTLQIQKKEATVLCLMFAHLYREPNIDLWKEINQKGLLNKLEDKTSNLPGVTKEVTLTDFPKTFDEWKHNYFQCIHGGGKEANRLVESIYKIWTTDSTCGMPFARSKGYLLGDSAMHIQFLLEKFDISIPTEYSHTPDHLVILLELLSYFIENAPIDFTIQFIEDHFDWLDLLIEKLTSHSENNFFLNLTYLLRSSLNYIKDYS